MAMSKVTMLLRIGSKTYRADDVGVVLEPRKSKVLAIRERAKKRRGRARNVAPPAYPSSAELAYAKEVLALCREAKAVLRARLERDLDRIFAVSETFVTNDAATVRRTDDYAKIISTAFAEIELEFEARTKARARRAAGNAAGRTEKGNAKEHKRWFKNVIGLDVTQAEPWLTDFVDLFVESNVGLIKSIHTRYFGEVRDIVEAAAITGRRPEGLAREIEERFGVSKSRARLLARDQVGKLNSQITAARQQRLGIKKYIWRTSGDERVRESHRAKEGRDFLWQDPPNDTGHPGEDFQCRCTAEASLDDISQE